VILRPPETRRQSICPEPGDPPLQITRAPPGRNHGNVPLSATALPRCPSPGSGAAHHPRRSCPLLPRPVPSPEVMAAITPGCLKALSGPAPASPTRQEIPLPVCHEHRGAFQRCSLWGPKPTPHATGPRPWARPREPFLPSDELAPAGHPFAQRDYRWSTHFCPTNPGRSFARDGGPGSGSPQRGLPQRHPSLRRP